MPAREYRESWEWRRPANSSAAFTEPSYRCTPRWPFSHSSVVLELTCAAAGCARNGAFCARKHLSGATRLVLRTNCQYLLDNLMG